MQPVVCHLTGNSPPAYGATIIKSRFTIGLSNGIVIMKYRHYNRVIITKIIYTIYIEVV